MVRHSKSDTIQATTISRTAPNKSVICRRAFSASGPSHSPAIDMLYRDSSYERSVADPGRNSCLHIPCGNSKIMFEIHRSWSVSICRSGTGRGPSLWVSPVNSYSTSRLFHSEQCIARQHQNMQLRICAATKLCSVRNSSDSLLMLSMRSLTVLKTATTLNLKRIRKQVMVTEPLPESRQQGASRLCRGA